MDLLKRRAEILAHNTKQSKTRGSGWHPSELTAKQDEDMPLVDRILAFEDDGTIHVVGDCVDKVKSCLEEFIERLKARTLKAEEKGRPPPDLIGHGYHWQTVAVKFAKEVLAMDDAISLKQPGWNYVNSILEARKVLVSMSSAEIDE